ILHRLKAVASGYGSKPDWSAFGGHGANLRDVEVVVRFRWRLVLDVVGPHLVGHVAAGHDPVTPRPQMLAHLRSMPNSLSSLCESSHLRTSLRSPSITLRSRSSSICYCTTRK